MLSSVTHETNVSDLPGGAPAVPLPARLTATEGAWSVRCILPDIGPAVPLAERLGGNGGGLSVICALPWSCSAALRSAGDGRGVSSTVCIRRRSLSVFSFSAPRLPPCEYSRDYTGCQFMRVSYTSYQPLGKGNSSSIEGCALTHKN